MSNREVVSATERRSASKRRKEGPKRSGGNERWCGKRYVTEAGSGRVMFVSAEGFGVEAWIVCEPPHVGCAVQIVVGKPSETVA